MPDKRLHRVSVVFLCSLTVMLSLTVSQAAGATTSYLRANADIPMSSVPGWPGYTTMPWQITGAASAWDALNDPVTESETPSSTDYIAATATKPGTVNAMELGLASTPLGGASILSASVWVYTAEEGFIYEEVLSGEEGLGSQIYGKAGWHSVPIGLNGTQSQLDNLTIRLIGMNSGGAGKVTAAFLRLSLEPLSPIYWGAWIDGDVYNSTEDAPWGESTWNEFEKHTGKPVSIVHFGQPSPWIKGFSKGPLELAANRGAIPLIDMGSDFEESSPHVSLEDIAKHKRDADIKTWAKAVANYAKPFFFRWDWEMNGKWFKWGDEASSNPSLYREAWQDFHKIADEQGATNITWVWCPNVSFSGSTSLKSLYPGDAYVDWTCMDGYNFGGSSWSSFSKLFSPTYEELLSIAPAKPIMIGETASAETGGSKAKWITEALEVLPASFPRIRAFNWFNWNIMEEGVRRDWQIESSEASKAAFAKGISSSYFAKNSFGSLTPLTRIQPIP